MTRCDLQHFRHFLVAIPLQIQYHDRFVQVIQGLQDHRQKLYMVISHRLSHVQVRGDDWFRSYCFFVLPRFGEQCVEAYAVDPGAALRFSLVRIKRLPEL